MRLYYSFITGIAGWLGVSFYEHIAEEFRTVETGPTVIRKGVILVILFLSWGINQILNDFLGLKEDRINAPNRPMVTGELNPFTALSISGILIAFTCIITWLYLEPLAIIPLTIGIILNIVYEYAKGFGIIANILFGLMITMCAAFGFLAAGPSGPPYFTSSRVSVLTVVWIMNGLMTFYTYFKDVRGDREAGKQTVVVKYGLEKSRVMAILLSFLPSALFTVFYASGMIEAPLNRVFIILGILTVFLEIWTGFLYYKNPEGRMTYYSLAVNFRACTCGQATFIALFNKELALILFIVSYVFVGFLFNLHTNYKA